MTARKRLVLLLRERLPAWSVGDWRRGILLCVGPGGAKVLVEDRADAGTGRWRGFELNTGEPADWEGTGDWYAFGARIEWVEDLVDRIVAAVGRIGTRTLCPKCQGHGIEHACSSCPRCGGEGRVLREVAGG